MLSLQRSKTGTIPYAFAIDAEANKIYVANYGSDNVTVINGQKSH